MLELQNICYRVSTPEGEMDKIGRASCRERVYLQV